MANDADDITSTSRALSMGAVEELVGFRFRRIQNEMGRRFKARISRAEINPGMFSALALIRANEGLSQSELAAEIGMDRATVVALLDALEANGWARRTRDPVDRRRHSLSVTADGSREMARLEKIARENEASIHKALGVKGMTDLRRLLDRIDEVLSAESDAAPQRKPAKK